MNNHIPEEEYRATVPVRVQVLQDGVQVTKVDRNKAYGEPVEDMIRQAKLWSAYLGVHIRPDQVPVCMALTKIGRMAHSPEHRDSAMDGAVYLAIAHEVATAMSEDF